MLKISKSVEYSILALQYISDNEVYSSLSSKKISSELKIPYELLSKILQKLVKQGIIRSQQGKYGGYKMLIPSNKLTIFNIINALGENVQLTNCTVNDATTDDCGRLNNCNIRSPFWNLQNKINEVFHSITLKELTN